MKADFKTTGKEQCNLIHIILYITATTQTVEHKIKVTMIIGMQLSFDWFKADAEPHPHPPNSMIVNGNMLALLKGPAK